MQHIYFDNILRVVFFAISFGYAGVSSAHDAGATMDPDGINASFTGYAQVTCFNDGNGDADHLVASISDTSPPQNNLLVNLQIIKGKNAVSITDPVSGDGVFSPEASIAGGNGVYLMLVNKTGAGPRSFIVSYHCMTFNNVHTGTDILVNQFQ